MYNFPIGVILSSFRTDRATALKKAAAMGANGIQMYATSGENAPEALNAQARRDLLREVKDQGMVLPGWRNSRYVKDENPLWTKRGMLFMYTLR